MPLKVLVVDDATFVRDLVKRTLRQMIPDLDLYEAQDGARAQGLIKSKSPDLILSDWEMPEMSGDELVRWLRQQPQFEKTPFVMITSRGDRNHVIEAVNAGVSDYLSKPFTADELTRKIAKQLKVLNYVAPARRGVPPAMAMSSLDVLTGKSTSNSKPAAQAPGKNPLQAANAAASKFDGKAFLRFPNSASELQIRELSVQAIGGSIGRADAVPQIFEQVSVDLISASGEAMARINAYIHSVSAGSPSPDCDTIRVIVRFVDDDPTKLAVIQGLIE